MGNRNQLEVITCRRPWAFWYFTVQCVHTIKWLTVPLLGSHDATHGTPWSIIAPFTVLHYSLHALALVPLLGPQCLYVLPLAPLLGSQCPMAPHCILMVPLTTVVSHTQVWGERTRFYLRRVLMRMEMRNQTGCWLWQRERLARRTSMSTSTYTVLAIHTYTSEPLKWIDG